MTMEALTEPEVIRCLWIPGPFEKTELLFSSIYPSDIIPEF